MGHYTDLIGVKAVVMLELGHSEKYLAPTLRRVKRPQ